MGAYGESVDIFNRNFKPLSDDQQIVLQAAYMRVSTAPGTYWDDPDYGILLTELVNADLSEDDLLSLESRVKAQLELDERIDTAIVAAVIEETTGGSVSVRMTIRLVPSEGEAFTFTLRASDATVELLTGGETA